MPSKKILKINQAFLSEEQLSNLAHKGTKEAIEKIKEYLKIEQDDSKRFYAEMSLEECEFLYYGPTNDKEEEEFTLCVLNSRKQEYINDLVAKAYGIKAKLDKFDLEMKVHKKVLLTHKDKKEEWKYNHMEEFVFGQRNELIRLEEEIAYSEAWITESKKMIKSAKYKAGISKSHLEHFSFDFDDDVAEDDYDCKDENCSCHDDHCLDFNASTEIPF